MLNEEKKGMEMWRGEGWLYKGMEGKGKRGRDAPHLGRTSMWRLCRLAYPNLIKWCNKENHKM